jgi:hypothetical protein
MLRLDQNGFDKKHVRTHYAELVFLHPVGSMSLVVHSGASRVRNIDALFFMIRWAWCGFHKKHAGTHYSRLLFLHPMGFAAHVVNYGAFDP